MRNKKVLFLVMTMTMVLAGCRNTDINEAQNTNADILNNENTIVVDENSGVSTVAEVANYDIVDFDVPTGESLSVLFYEEDGVRTEKYYIDTTVVEVSKEYKNEESALAKYQILSEIYTAFPAKSDYGIVKSVGVEGNIVTLIENRVIYHTFSRDEIIDYANQNAGVLIRN